MTILKSLTPLVLACSCVVAGCGKPQAGFDEIMAEGMKEYDAHNYRDALGVFKQAAEADRERPEPSYYKGLCYLGMADRQFKDDNLPAALRQCDAAIAAFDASIGAFPGYSRSVQAKADALKLKGKHAAALDIANWAARNCGPQAKMLILKGRQYAQAGDLDQAQLAFKQATTVEPNNAAAFAEMGLFFMRCGNDREAITYLRKAYELDPGAPGVVAALARLGAAPEPAPAQTPAP